MLKSFILETKLFAIEIGCTWCFILSEVFDSVLNPSSMTRNVEDIKGIIESCKSKDRHCNEQKGTKRKTMVEKTLHRKLS